MCLGGTIMTLQQMRYAVEIADCGSINEAAKKLFISQPSLSGTIKDLENELDITLFLRSNRGKKIQCLHAALYVRSSGFHSPR